MPQVAGLAGRDFVSLGVGHEGAQPGRCDLDADRIAARFRRIIILAQQFGHAVFGHDALPGDAERRRQAGIEFVARDSARTALEPTGLHHERARGSGKRAVRAFERIEQGHEGERGARHADGAAARDRLVQRAGEPRGFDCIAVQEERTVPVAALL